MDEFLDPRLLQQNVVPANEDDLFGADVKPKIEADEVKAETPEHDEEMEDLFGDEEAGAEPAKEEKSPTPAVSTGREGSEALSATELRHRQEMEYEEDEGQDENVVELKHAVLSIPNIPMPNSSDGNYWVIKMPNFVRLDPKPFHPDTYTGPDQSYGISEREKSMSIRLDAENTIRWRWNKDEYGQETRQSNARVVRWSDGTLSLLLGKELFDINQTYEGVSRQPSGLGSFSQSQTQSQSQIPSQGSQQAPGARGSGLTYLVAQHKRSGILQTEVPITGHMTLRPTGMQSETHRRLARAVGQKHSRVARLRMADANAEHEAQEALKAAQKKPKRARVAGTRENGELGGPARRRRVGYVRRRERESVWSDEEPGVFEETDEEDEGDYDSSPRKRRGSGDGRKDGDAKRGAGEYQTDDFLVADTSEDEEDLDGSPKRKHKGKKHRRRSDEHDADGEADELEKLDAKIAQQEEERRRRKQASEVKEEDARESAVPPERAKSEELAMDMDVESEEEEEEEEFNVRRTGTGSRKKRAIALDDDEDE